MQHPSQSSSSGSAGSSVDAAIAASSPSSGLLPTNSARPTRSNNRSMTVPVPPTGPKPANLAPSSLRHKFLNSSIGSLPTAVATGEALPEEDFDERSNSSSSESGLDTDSECSREDAIAEEDEEELAETPDDDNSKEPARNSFADAGSDLSPLAKSTLAPPEEDRQSVADLSSDDEESSQATDDVRSFTTERPLTEVEPDDLSQPQEFLNMEDGIKPPHQTPRCPPKAWLAAAGFDVPTGSGFDAVPIAPVAGERPTRYLDLFCRQMLSRQQTSDLTTAAVLRHNEANGHLRHTDVKTPGLGKAASQNGEWLEGFKVRARAQPLCEVACSAVGSDVGQAVAGFLDNLSDASAVSARIGMEDVPDGLHVSGRKVIMRSVHRGRGRSGFYVDSDAGISTPGRSQSPVPQRQPPPLPVEPPAPPMIRGPGQTEDTRGLRWGF